MNENENKTEYEVIPAYQFNYISKTKIEDDFVSKIKIIEDNDVSEERDLYAKLGIDRIHFKDIKHLFLRFLLDINLNTINELEFEDNLDGDLLKSKIINAVLKTRTLLHHQEVNDVNVSAAKGNAKKAIERAQAELQLPVNSGVYDVRTINAAKSVLRACGSSAYDDSSTWMQSSAVVNATLLAVEEWAIKDFDVIRTKIVDKLEELLNEKRE